jgi:hypothetical protein
MIYIKDHFSNEEFETTFYSLFPALWVPPQIDLSIALISMCVLSLLMALESPTSISATDPPAEKIHTSSGR